MLGFQAFVSVYLYVILRSLALSSRQSSRDMSSISTNYSCRPLNIIMPITILLFWNYSHKIGGLLFVLVLGDLMASATCLANPSLLTIFLPMVPGDSGLISSKRWSSSCRSAICWNSSLQIVSSYYCLCLWRYVCIV